MKFYSNPLARLSLSIILILSIWLSAIACAKENQGGIIQQNEAIGKAWQEYVLDYESSIISVSVSPPTSIASSILYNAIEITNQNVISEIIKLVISAEKYVTGSVETGTFFEGSMTGCNLTLHNKSDKFHIGILENQITIAYDTSKVYFVTETSLKEIMDKIVTLAEPYRN